VNFIESAIRSLRTPSAKRMRHEILSPRLWMRRVAFWGGAVAVGCAAVLFALGAEEANRLQHDLVSFSPYLPLLVTPLTFAAVAWITQRYFQGSQGSGIPQTIAALENESLRANVLSLRIAFGKVLLTLAGLVAGASIGREGPTVQVGASIMHTFSRFGGLSRADIDRSLILAGGAAGVAAAFNTPLAGIVFAIEEMSRSFEQRTNGTILTAVILAGVTSMAALGAYPYFGFNSASLTLDKAWTAVLVCGLGGGVLGGLFSRMLIAGARGLPGRIGIAMREQPVAFAAACGAALALIGLVSGSTTYGTGYQEAKGVIEGQIAVPEAYGILKLLANVVSYFSGIPGGIFAPSLAVGAGLGINAAQLMPYVPVGSVILLSVVGYFAGVVQAPMTAFVIVIEMTESHTMVLPLMAAALLASGTSRLICKRPLYQALAEEFLKKQAS
jgi:H+/Cl- antiporter ClcA